VDRLVALKLLPREHAGEQVERKRFLKEVRAASALNHPNVWVIYAIVDPDPVVSAC